MTETLLIAGTASHVGKSTVAAGLCRLFDDRGVDVAPFKAQNMSNNAQAVPRTTGEGFGEIGVSQYVQARAARIRPTTDHNPVLLKPRGEGESQLVIDGEAVGHFEADEYYAETWEQAVGASREAHARLAADHEVIVAEGAGSIAEINLHDRDLANVETARFADADILLVADIERGGVFASLVGTLELLPDDLRDRVVGAAITKFRGDRSVLDPGLEAFEERTGVPILGVLPYDDPGLPAEDSVDLPEKGERSIEGVDDGIPTERAVTIAVPRLPRISNFTDLEPLAREPGVRVEYRPLDAAYDDADGVVIPGTKNSVDDLLACREAGLDDALHRFEGPIVGLCGGYQLLGERITNAAVEGTGDQADVLGFGLLPVETIFSEEKRVEPAAVQVDGVGPLAGVAGRVTGYEIHMGETRATGAVSRPFADPAGDRNPVSLGAAEGNVLGTYLHGIFENEGLRDAFLDTAFGSSANRPASRVVPAPADRAGSLVDTHLDLDNLEPVLASGSADR
ncbi:MAG: adenosylcobyric acid synthase [Halobacteriales archaeon]|jgi:adenosylcobyric acid synthase